MKKNSAIITGLFMLIVLAFTIDPIFIYHFQNNILGKAIVILILIYLTTNNVTFGLLFTLAIILLSSRIDVPMIEGFKSKKSRKARIKRDAKMKAQARDETIKRKQDKRKQEKRKQQKCKTLEELLREERVKRMEKKMDDKNVETPAITNNQTNGTTANTVNNNDVGVDRVSVEETFRVRNPSTIPVTKEAFRVRELNPSDNASKYYGGSCSLV